jgi:hypothetical protein
MTLFDQIILLLTGLTAVYLIWRFYGRYSAEKNLHDIYYMLGFIVLFVSGVLLIFGGWGVLGAPNVAALIKVFPNAILIFGNWGVTASPYVLPVATLIPLGISMGLMNQFMPEYKKAYAWFALIGLLAIAVSSIGNMPALRKISVPLFHGVAGLIIFGLPLYLCFGKKTAPKGFAMVGVGGLLIGIGGIALAFVVNGSQFLFFSLEVILTILPLLLLLMTLAFTWGFMKDIKAE